jgi:hypothetical protein
MEAVRLLPKRRWTSTGPSGIASQKAALFIIYCDAIIMKQDAEGVPSQRSVQDCVCCIVKTLVLLEIPKVDRVIDN